MLPYTDSLSLAAESLCATARWCYAQGWAPATSGNFSVRDREAGCQTRLVMREGNAPVDDPHEHPTVESFAFL